MITTGTLEGRVKLMSAGSADQRSRPLSLRLSAGELTRIREIARRLGTTETAVLRFAVRNTLKQLAPLHDPNAGGLSLLPVFVERGAELAASFDLDVGRLDQIINQSAGRSDGKKVDRDDLALLAMAGLGDSRIHAKLREMQADNAETQNSATLIRTYFYRKYIYDGPTRKDAAATAGAAPPPFPDFDETQGP